MKKDVFYSLCKNLDTKENVKIKRQGYILETNSNKFGFYKKFNKFDIIDLKTGLSINFLRYHRLKDFKNNINLFDDKLNDYKNENADYYNNLCSNFENANIEVV